MAQTGLIGGSFPTHKTPMTLIGNPAALADGQESLQVRFESGEVGGVQLATTYTLRRGAYDIAVSHEVINRGAGVVAGAGMGGRPGMPGQRPLQRT